MASEEEYLQQLQAINQVLEECPEGAERTELLSLKQNIEELLSLTNEVKSYTNLSIEKDPPETIDNTQETQEKNVTPLEDEYALFMAEMAKEGAIEVSNSNSANEDQCKKEHTILKSSKNLKYLEGKKFRAPHKHQWGQVVYHNAMVCSVPDEIPVNDEFQVKVLFLNPTHKEMQPCPYYFHLEKDCNFTDEECRFSHGEMVPFSSLQEYVEPKFELLTIGSDVLAKQSNDLWYRAKITQILKEKCLVKFESKNVENQSFEEVIFAHILPLKTSENASEEDSGGDSDIEVVEDFEMQLKKDREELINISLMNTPEKEQLGDWEKYTKGIGSRLMQKMGYIVGTGLGKKGSGIIKPVTALILPQGKSLDYCMNLKEKRNNPNLFSADPDVFKSAKRKNKHLQRKENRRAKAQMRYEKMNIVKFINSRFSCSKQNYVDSNRASTTTNHHEATPYSLPPCGNPLSENKKHKIEDDTAQTPNLSKDTLRFPPTIPPEETPQFSSTPSRAPTSGTSSRPEASVDVLTKFVDKIRVKRLNICGAERKRRKRARIEREAKAALSLVLPSSAVVSGSDLRVDPLTKSVDKIRVKRLNICGAERKRRKKAKIEREANAALSLALSSSAATGGSYTGAPFKDISASQAARGSKKPTKSSVGDSSNAVPIKDTAPNPCGSKIGAAGTRARHGSGVSKDAPQKSTNSQTFPVGSHGVDERIKGEETATTKGLCTQEQTPKGASKVQNIGLSLQVIICREDNPNRGFTEDELLEFIDAVGEVIANTADGSKVISPQFTETRLWRGQMLVVAANMPSKDWLLRNLSNIRPWQGVSLTTMDPDVLRLRKTILWISGKKHRSNEDVFTFLERQNTELSTSKWRIWEREEEPQGLRMVIGMDESSISTIAKLDYRPYYSLTRARVYVPDSSPGAAGSEKAKEAGGTKSSSSGNQRKKEGVGDLVHGVIMEGTENSGSSAVPTLGIRKKMRIFKEDRNQDTVLTSTVLKKKAEGSSQDGCPSN